MLLTFDSLKSHVLIYFVFMKKLKEDWVFVIPGPRPQFVFDGPGLNLYLAAPVLNLDLPALAN